MTSQAQMLEEMVDRFKLRQMAGRRSNPKPQQSKSFVDTLPSYEPAMDYGLNDTQHSNYSNGQSNGKSEAIEISLDDDDFGKYQ